VDKKVEIFAYVYARYIDKYYDKVKYMIIKKEIKVLI